MECFCWKSLCDSTSWAEMPTTVAGRSRMSSGRGSVGAELLCADRRVVARVEEQHHTLAAMVGEPERSVRPLELEVGCGVAFFGGAHGAVPFVSGQGRGL